MAWFEGLTDSRHRSPAREGWFENVKCHMQVTSCKSVDFGAQIGSAGDVRVSSPPWGVRPQNCRVSGHGGHGSIEDDETKHMASTEPRHMDFSDRVCQRAVKGAKGGHDDPLTLI